MKIPSTTSASIPAATRPDACCAVLALVLAASCGGRWQRAGIRRVRRRIGRLGRRQSDVCCSREYAFAFEVTSILILVAMIGASCSAAR